MDWSDEHYVKLFTRDTVTWRSWPWQARALFPLMLRKVDNTGFFDVGKKQPELALAIMVELPSEVVGPGLEAVLADGTVELVEGRLLLPNFVDAQESRKTNKAKARDYRNRKRDHARANISKSLEGTVTARHRSSPLVTPTNPPALPCSALLLKTYVSQATPPAPEPSAPRPLDEVALVFEHWKRATKKPRSQLDPKRRRLIELRLAEGHTREDLCAAIDGYARSPWHNGENDRHKKYLGIGLMLRDSEHVESGQELSTQFEAVAQPQTRSLAL
jgi:hypothetical protein